MPLVRVDMHDTLAERRPDMSAAIHRGLVTGLEMAPEDLFQIFSMHPEGDLFYTTTYPNADRNDIVYVQILLANLYTPEIKQRAAKAVVDELVGVGIKRDNILIAVTVNGDGDWYAPEKDEDATA